MSRVTQLEAQYDKIKAEEERLFQELEDYKAQGLDTSLPVYQNKAQQFVDLRSQVQTLSNQIYQAKNEEASTPRDTAASNLSTSTGGATQNPPSAVLVVPQSEVNQVRDLGPAQQSEEVTRNGGQQVPQDDAPGSVRTTTVTQSVSPAPSSDGRPEPGGNPGVGAPNDDSGTRQNTSKIINGLFNTKIQPKGNVLDEFASYTYNISWYLLEPNTYKTLIESRRRSLNGFQLLAQSGGAPTNTASAQPQQNPVTGPGADSSGVAQPGRNPFFNLDYYIDNLEISSKITGAGNRMAHNAVDLKFTVTEPTGITLINNLYQAVQSVYKGTAVPYATAQYALVIRFYGYDSNGNLVVKNRASATDPQAVVEKFYPFIITNIKFRLASRAVEYAIEGKPIPHLMGFSQNLGVVKSPFELTGTTVSDILGGKTVGATNTVEDDGRTDTPQPPAVPYTSLDVQNDADWYNRFGANNSAEDTLRG